jgi:uncharacterized protein (TIGR03067 family)
MRSLEERAMNSRTKLFLTIVLGWSSVVPAAESVEGDLARLQGRWVTKAGNRRNIVVSLQVEGRRARVNITMPRGLKLRAEGELRLNERTEPRSLDWVGFSGPDSQDLPDLPAIYRIDGTTFKVCNGGFNNPRPSSFTPGDGVLADVHVFERAK